MRKTMLILCLTGIAMLFCNQSVMAKDIIKNHKTWAELESHKKPLDDPRPIIPYYKELWGKEVLEEVSFDVEKGSQRWADMVGFKSPDRVGKIAPEIKPGKYTLKDKTKYPFDKLMPRMFYDRFNEPGGQGSNFAGNFTEFEVVPTRQYWQPLNLAEASIKNEGKAKLGEDGYMLYDTYEGGVPFPKPSGPQKGWQLIYNYMEFYWQGEDFLAQTATFGIDSKFKVDRYSKGDYYSMRTYHRLIQEPKGAWFDKRAEAQQERQLIYYRAIEPRDQYGQAYVWIKRVLPDDADNFMVYTPLTRRIRKMSSSDKQDQAIGLDYAYDDTNNLSQKLTPDLYPYKVRVLEEREYLMPTYTMEGTEYFDSKSQYLWRNLTFERRPVYVVEMEQLDPTYIYSRRVYYIDQETFIILGCEFYDQKNRLWRTSNCLLGFIPETGFFWWVEATYFDHIDVHSTIELTFNTVSLKSDRTEFSARRLLRGWK